MRLTCPNCGAQYEVPDEVIPTEGRDVQCSNCGNTWFQYHPDNAPAEQDPETGADMPEPVTADSVPEDLDWTEDVVEDTSEDVSDRPEAVSEDDDNAAGDGDSGHSKPAVQREIDPAVADILRQEAEHEARLRASESGDTLESQPDLGLDSLGSDEAERRSREARDRMLRMRGQPPEDADATGDAETGSRRGLLPDIDEINSTLRASGESAELDVMTGATAAENARKSSSFTRGFSLVLVLMLILVMIYSKAGKISEAVPQVAPLMDIYVVKVDQGRVWLDATISRYTPK